MCSNRFFVGLAARRGGVTWRFSNAFVTISSILSFKKIVRTLNSVQMASPSMKLSRAKRSPKNS